MKKLLVICGPTATGKTKLALHLAKKFDGELVSADSRQVYRGMNIGTGKDLPEKAQYRISNIPTTPSQTRFLSSQSGLRGASKYRNKKVAYYIVDGLNIWGYDLIDPKKEFSVSHYSKFAGKILEDIYSRNKLPILVGGTGLYIKAVVDGIETSVVPKNQNLRDVLEKYSTDDLYEKLSELDSIRSASLNVSDKNNPRRLIRAIEVAQYKLGDQKNVAKLSMNRFIDSDTKVFFLGLKNDFEILKKRISKRVQKRISEGIEDEIRSLLSSGVTWQMQSMTSLGYRQFREYFEGKISEEEAIKKWQSEEVKYAKRQLTWFKKDKRINWFEAGTEKDLKSVEKEVKKWYDEKDDKKD